MRASLLVYIPHSISCLGDDGDRILRSCPCTLRFLEVCCRLRQIFHLAVAAPAIAIPSTLMFSVGPGSRFCGFVGGDRLITF